MMKYESKYTRLNLDIDMKEATAYDGAHCYFFRSRFEDGTVLAWYSHSPWGRCNDMEQGWVVIDLKKKTILDDVATRMMGEATGEYRDWIIEQRKIHGKTKSQFRYPDGRLIWVKSRDA